MSPTVDVMPGLAVQRLAGGDVALVFDRGTARQAVRLIPPDAWRAMVAAAAANNPRECPTPSASPTPSCP